MSIEYFLYKGVNFAPGIHFEENLNFAENEFQVLDDDVFNVTYPKSGTNWMLEILNLIKCQGDPTWCNSVPNWERSPWYETRDGQSQIKDVLSPRVLCSHLPFHIFSKSFFTSKAKIIYTMRNPKDVFVSLFYFAKILSLYNNTENFQLFLENFLQGDVLYGTWFDHVKGWMQMKDNRNVFFITYEELQQDLRGSVVKICEFLGKELDDAAIDLVVKHSSFQSMKENKMSNYSLLPQEMLNHKKGSWFRKGISGDWKNHFTVAQSEYFDRVYQEKMKDLNMKFFWEK
ncbi:sulfotransferase 2B1-like [Ascaphus truei]|uniref:sulfotransferase 2B1-like n=1 Tax=Ascaphus truei TaxID=8439 RepID=UPI003F59D16F